MKIVAKLWTRDFTGFTLGSMVSQLGSTVQFQFFLLWMTYASGSPTKISLFTTIPGLISLLVVLLGAVHADRNDRKIILLRAYAGLATVVALGAVLMPLPYFKDMDAVFWIIILISCLSSLVSSYAAPAGEAFFINMVSPQSLAQARSMTQISRSTASIVGEGLAGFLVSTVSMIWILIANSLSFVAAFLAVLPIKSGVRQSAIKPGQRRFWDEIRFGFAYVAAEKPILWLIVLAIGLNSTWAIVETFYAYYLKTALGLPPQLYGLQRGLVSFMTLVGIALAPLALRRWPRKQFNIFLGSSLLAQALFIGLLMNDRVYPVIILFALLSLALGLQQIVIWNAVQRSIDNSVLGRIHGIWTFLVGILTPASVWTASVFLEKHLVSIDRIFWSVAILQPLLTIGLGVFSPLGVIFLEKTNEDPG